MAIEHWTTDADGKVEVYPLVAFETLVAHGSLCALKLHYLTDPARLLGGEPSSVPLIMRPEMARAIAAALTAAADEAELGPTGEIAH